MTRRARGFIPARIATASTVVLDTTFPRHLAVLGEPYLRWVITGVLGARGRIPPAVRGELMRAKRHAPSVLVLLPPRGLLEEVRLSPDRLRVASALADQLPEKTGGRAENLGEAQAIVLAGDLRAPLVIDDGDGILMAGGRGIAVVLGVHLLQHAVLAGALTVDQGWDVWERLCSGGGFRPSTRVTGWDTCADCETTFRTSIAAAVGPAPSAGRGPA